ARVVAVEARVHRHLEVLETVRVAGPEVLLGGVLALGDGDRVRLLGRAAGACASPELPPAPLESRAELLAGVVTALERDDLRLVDAAVAVGRPFRKPVPAVLLRARQRRITGGESLVDPRGLAAILPLGAAHFHALVVAIETCVLRDLEILHAAGLAVPELAACVLDARVAPRRRSAERDGDLVEHADADGMPAAEHEAVLRKRARRPLDDNRQKRNARPLRQHEGAHLEGLEPPVRRASSLGEHHDGAALGEGLLTGPHHLRDAPGIAAAELDVAVE